VGISQQPTVLCVDDDRDMAELVEAVLTDEGYAVSVLYSLDDDAVLRAAGRLEPDCILLDSASSVEYGSSWEVAADLAERFRPVPVVMFSAHTPATQEAAKGESERAVKANFAAVLPKPFHLDDLLTCVATAVGRSVSFDRSAAAENQRTKALVRALEARGATDISPSKLREWALFRDRGGSLVQLYWWQQHGVYQVGRYAEDGRMTMVGQFVNRDAAIEQALPPAG
jgi:CheY-like chemotaxis protein